jgi:hypothetical protein
MGELGGGGNSASDRTGHGLGPIVGSDVGRHAAEDALSASLPSRGPFCKLKKETLSTLTSGRGGRRRPI